MVAVVIPYYKIQFFKDTLVSLANQTNKNFRVYIGDDASPEDPSALLDLFKEELNITYTRFSNNLGGDALTKQWKRCVALLQDEDWIMVLCDDDILGENVIEEFYKNLDEIKKEGAHVINYATQVIDENGTPISRQFEHPKLQSYSEYFNNRFFKGSHSSLSEHIFSKERYDKYGFRDLPMAWHSDDLAWLEFSEFGIIFSINASQVYFRLSNLNISRPFFMVKEKEFYRYSFFSIVIKEYLSRFQKDHISDILRSYEIMTYKLGKGGFLFWIKYLPLIIKYIGLFEGLKFTRRILINQQQNGKRGIHNYS